MDGFCYPNRTLIDPSVVLIMDNDSGYVSNNLDQESNSTSNLDNSTSTVDILRSFLPKPVYLSEDALLERPETLQNLIEDKGNCQEDSPDILINSSVNSEKFNKFPSFSSFQSDTDVSDSSVVIPLTEPIYFDLNTGHSTNFIRDQSTESTMIYLENETYKNITSDFISCVQVEQVSCTNQSLNKMEGLPKMTEKPAPSSSFSKTCTPKKRNQLNAENNVLSNLTNICDKTEKSANHSESSDKNSGRMRKFSTSSNNKENISQNVEVFKTPKKGLKRKFIETGSPDLFSDDENYIASQLQPSPKTIEERYIHKLDHKLLKRVQKEVSGVPPPPDFTITKFTVDDILQRLQSNEDYFWTNETTKSGENVEPANKSKNSSFDGSGSILVDGNLEEAIHKEFPQILHSRHHGLHHNRNKLSEEIEHLCDKYARRYIGAETQSTCCALDTKYMSPSKKKTVKQKWVTKSPGRRLSHLARRRITFSSANLHAAGSSSATSRARQILIDYKKLEPLNYKKSPRKSPRKTPRKTPNKSPSQGRTPSSSAKKKLRMRFRLLSGDFKEATAGPSSAVPSNIQCSKRALFQSPDSHSRFDSILSNSSNSSCSSFNNDLNSRGMSTKRSLFSSPNRIGFKSSLFSSPNRKSSFQNISCFEKKRKRDETDENNSVPAKFFRSQSTDTRSSNSESSCLNTSMPTSQSHDLSAAHKKKLQWAVYESLKLQNITTAHPQFKVYASVLARVTRRLILSANARSEGGTSERMFRIARHHSYAVVRGKSVEEIMSEYNRNKAKSLKPQGYIAPEDYHKYQNRESSTNRDSVLKDRANIEDANKSSSSRSSGTFKVESRIDRIRKVINFEDSS